MIKVAIILPPFFKYPNYNGCAVETLITILGEQNNKYKKIDLNIINKKSNKNNNGIIKLNKIDEGLFLLYRIIKKLFKKDVFFLDRYYYKVYKFILLKNFDYIIYEAGDVKKYKKISNKVGKSKMIYHIHHDPENETIMVRNIIKSTFGNYIGVSEYVIKQIKKLTTNDIKTGILKNCTNANNFINIDENEKVIMRENLTLQKKDFVVLYVGRLIKEKGINELINAIKHIDNSQIKLLILGSTFSEGSKDTEFSKNLKKSIKGIEKRVIFTGYIPHSEIFKYYQIADIQVIPTICEEAAGLVAIEGMKCGLPIVATKSGGMIEYIDETCATIVDKDNKLVSNLEKAILELYNDKEKCKIMGRNGKKRAKQFNEKKYYTDFVNLIERLGK
ncbi:MAG: glycosyltransferase family 4 protein [Erysipelotrichaceae bacterium]|nr:glycosyltransferase family 4 protein [Erysipelotrichaceae bacterium]